MPLPDWVDNKRGGVAVASPTVGTRKRAPDRHANKTKKNEDIKSESRVVKTRGAGTKPNDGTTELNQGDKSAGLDGYWVLRRGGKWRA